MFRIPFAAACLGAVLLAGPAQARTISDEAAEGFTGSEFEWLLRDDLLLMPDAGEPGALAVVAKAMREDDPRAGQALQNYLDRYPKDPAAFDLAGTHLLAIGEYTQAALALEHALKLSGGTAPWIRAKLGAAREALEQPKAARTQYERALRADRTNPVALRGLQRLAAAEGDLVAATRYGERSLAAFGLPRSSVNVAHVDLADLYMQAGRWEDAFDVLSPVLQSERLNVPDGFAVGVMGRLAQVATEIGAVDAARAALDRAAARLPAGAFDGPPWAVLEARTRRLEGDAEGALSILDRLSQTPQARRALLMERVAALSDTGRVQDALDQIAAALASDPAGEAARLTAVYRGVAESEGWPDGALDELKGALPSDPPETVALELARAELSAGDSAAARARAAPLAAANRETDPALRVDALRLLAALDHRDGKAQAAQARLRAALDLAPRDESLWLTLAAYTHDPGSHAHGTGTQAGHDALRDVLIEAREAVPESATIRAELGIIDFTAGKVDSAAAMFREALELAPQRPEINLLAALAIADAGGDLAQAAAMARFALDADPDNAAAMDALGWIRLQEGAPAEDALEWFDRALAIEPDDGTTLRHKAAALDRLGRNAEAATIAMAALADELAAHDRKAARTILVAARPADRVTAAIHRLTPEGAGERIGEVVFSVGSQGGLRVHLKGTGLPAGLNAVHVHEVASCAAGADGTLGGASGPHYGMDHGADGAAGDHATSGDGGTAMASTTRGADGVMKMADAKASPGARGTGSAVPRGDLVPATVNDDGRMDVVINAGWLTLDEVRGRSLMIHDGMGPDGGGGPKFACVLIG